MTDLYNGYAESSFSYQSPMDNRSTYVLMGLVEC